MSDPLLDPKYGNDTQYGGIASALIRELESQRDAQAYEIPRECTTSP